MKYTGVLSVTDFQVGDTVYIIENDVPVETIVTETESFVDEDENESVKYRLAGYEQKLFPSAEVFADKSSIKTYFEDATDGL